MSIVRSMLDAAQQRLAGFDFDVVTDDPVRPSRKPEAAAEAVPAKDEPAVPQRTEA